MRVGPLDVGALDVRHASREERPAVASLVAARWGSAQIVSRDRVHDAATAEAVVAVRGDEIVGAATFVVRRAWRRRRSSSRSTPLHQGQGIGSALVDPVARAAATADARQLVSSGIPIRDELVLVRDLPS